MVNVCLPLESLLAFSGAARPALSTRSNGGLVSTRLGRTLLGPLSIQNSARTASLTGLMWTKNFPDCVVPARGVAARLSAIPLTSNEPGRTTLADAVLLMESRDGIKTARVAAAVVTTRVTRRFVGLYAV